MPIPAKKALLKCKTGLAFKIALQLEYAFCTKPTLLKNTVIVAAVIAHNKRESQRLAVMGRILTCDNLISLSIRYPASVYQLNIIE